MPKTLLTGANGFVAAHVLDQLIAAGHTVVGSVRSPSKGEQILKTHPEYAPNLSFAIVSDYAAEGTWDQTIKDGDFDYIIHTAAPLLDNPSNTDFERDFLRPSVQGAVELLKSVQKYGKNVKHIAVTGSVNAMTTGMDLADRSFDSSSWLPMTIADAIAAQHPYISYCVGKAEGEKAIWKFVEDEKPQWGVSVLLPALIFGPPFQPVSDIKKMNYSTDRFYELFNGTNETVPATSFPSFVDVRDLAYAHIKALTTPEVKNKRFVIGGNKFSTQIAVDALKTVPELEGRLPKDGDEVVTQLKVEDVQSWNEKLGLKPRTPEETFGDAARKILELEKTLGGK